MGNYKNFELVVYFVAGGTKHTTDKKLREEIEFFKKYMRIDKVYLEPGETKVVTVELGPDAFRFFDEASMSWKTESGEFEILACSSSDKIRKSAKVVL